MSQPKDLWNLEFLLETSSTEGNFQTNFFSELLKTLKLYRERRDILVYIISNIYIMFIPYTIVP